MTAEEKLNLITNNLDIGVGNLMIVPYMFPLQNDLKKLVRYHF